jgi:hypothetical protein
MEGDLIAQQYFKCDFAAYNTSELQTGKMCFQLETGKLRFIATPACPQLGQETLNGLAKKNVRAAVLRRHKYTTF